MLFTSLQWIVFLVSVFTLFNAVPARARRWVMLAASICFYASWSVRYLALIFGQLTTDWTCGYLLGRTRSPAGRRLIVASSIVVNLGALCVFKYYGLFSHTLARVGLALPPLAVTLPLAISFYTFESMSYTIDVYRGRLAPVHSPIHLALFITWFPHLIAGPIIRPSEFVPQLDRVSTITRSRFFSGATLMLIGYAKKLLGADWLATVVDPVFADPSLYTSLELLVAVYAYAFQIYLDFSAYTDIARGASRWFGIELPENFDAPYLAVSITDFWRRWHMTLSHWLRDYLYIPLGGNRRGTARTYANLMITMLLGGLWHGASWTFVVWGGLHGLYLAVERALGVRADAAARRPWLRRFFTFHLVCFAWVFFRAQSFHTAGLVLTGIANGGFHFVAARLLPVVGTVTIIVGYWLMRPLRRRLETFVPGAASVPQLVYVAAASLFLITLMALGASTNAFIYFRF
jgi:D-alanyl-lipoteichoic acid acyltransferase DltB (MBOAT superfamily)